MAASRLLAYWCIDKCRLHRKTTGHTASFLGNMSVSFPIGALPDLRGYPKVAHHLLCIGKSPVISDPTADRHGGLRSDSPQSSSAVSPGDLPAPLSLALCLGLESD